MITKFFFFFTTSLLALSAPVQLETSPLPANYSGEPSKLVIVSVCLLNSTYGTRCKHNHFIAVKEGIASRRASRSPQYEEQPEGPNVEDYEVSSTTDPVESEGSGVHLLEGVHQFPEVTAEPTTIHWESTTPESRHVNETTTVAVKSTTKLTEEFVKQKLNTFEGDSKQLIRLLKELLEQRKASIRTTTEPGLPQPRVLVLYNGTEAPPTTTTSEFGTHVYVDDTTTSPATIAEAESAEDHDATTTAGSSEHRDSDEENLVEEEDKITIDGQEYSVKELEDALVEALLVDNPQ